MSSLFWEIMTQIKLMEDMLAERNRWLEEMSKSVEDSRIRIDQSHETIRRCSKSLDATNHKPANVNDEVVG